MANGNVIKTLVWAPQFNPLGKVWNPALTNRVIRLHGQAPSAGILWGLLEQSVRCVRHS